ncbi:MAG: hypothetical protein SFU25_01345, partial [Candidatus Caenarcaniphilales bacterium]|nr:hypothetical protein [Candidatus Caenarcaniphilales bacterium]
AFHRLQNISLRLYDLPSSLLILDLSNLSFGRDLPFLQYVKHAPLVSINTQESEFAGNHFDPKRWLSVKIEDFKGGKVGDYRIHYASGRLEVDQVVGSHLLDQLIGYIPGLNHLLGRGRVIKEIEAGVATKEIPETELNLIQAFFKSLDK